MVVQVAVQVRVGLDNLVPVDQDMVILHRLNKEILVELILLKMATAPQAAAAALAVLTVPLCRLVRLVLEELVQHPVLAVKALLEIFLRY